MTDIAFAIALAPRSAAETVELDEDAITWDERGEVLASTLVPTLETMLETTDVAPTKRTRRFPLRGTFARFFVTTTDQADAVPVVPVVSDERRRPRVQPRHRASYMEHAAMSREMYRL